MSLLVDTALRLGARRANPGEFSQRAFLNGKLDLAQAEAIADLIDSGTAQAARAAQRSLAGAFSTAVDALAEQLIRLRLHVEAAIDFPEEEIDFLSDAALARQIETCENAFLALTRQAEAGRLLRDGLQIVIVGRPNAGKSSLLNLLSGQDAAIVTELAGTTRDILRERIDIDGLAVELVDTAGLRDNPDTIEAEGIRRAKSAMAQADAVSWWQKALKRSLQGPHADNRTAAAAYTRMGVIAADGGDYDRGNQQYESVRHTIRPLLFASRARTAEAHARDADPASPRSPASPVL